MATISLMVKNWGIKKNRLFWERNGRFFSAHIIERNFDYYLVGSNRFNFRVYVIP